MDRPSQILGTATVFHVGHSLADQFGGIATQNLHAEDAVGVGTGDHLGKTHCRIGSQCPAIGGEIEFSDLNLLALFLGLRRRASDW